MNNPFDTKTPESNNSAQEIVDLFVDVFTDFNKVLEPGHTFLNGPRGSGKSMMFRYMLPDCQQLVTGKTAPELDFFAIYLPIKLTSVNNVDMNRFEEHANFLLNEHLLVSWVLSKSYQFIAEQIPTILNSYLLEVKEYYNYFVHASERFGVSCPSVRSVSRKTDAASVLRVMADVMSEQYQECWKLFSTLAFSEGEYPPINLPLVNFVDYMYPLMRELAKLPCFPKEKPLYLLVDDAGYLSLIQTKILNNWVSYRTVEHLCLKISTQLDYKSFQTTYNKKIDSPHDFSEVNIATIYTSSKNRYKERVKAIVEKRLHYYLHKDIKAEDFFPPNRAQEQAIREIYMSIKAENLDPERGYVGGDAAYRYAVPEYVKKLKRKRAGSTYSYSGFLQLVSISSGIVRHFLDAASKMYAQQLAETATKRDIMYISDSIQNVIIRDISERYLYNGMSGLNPDISKKLFNLVDSLGKLFHMILLSDLSERRVFSIVLNDEPDEELQAVLDAGVQEGFFHLSSLGAKSGLGRARKYVLTRMVAPFYQLDPTSFAGYQNVSCNTLKIALHSPEQFISSFKKLKSGSCFDPSLF